MDEWRKWENELKKAGSPHSLEWFNKKFNRNFQPQDVDRIVLASGGRLARYTIKGGKPGMRYVPEEEESSEE